MHTQTFAEGSAAAKTLKNTAIQHDFLYPRICKAIAFASKGAHANDGTHELIKEIENDVIKLKSETLYGKKEHKILVATLFGLH